MKRETDRIIALTDDHICKITGLSKHQLRSWDSRGFFIPKHAYDDRSKAYSRIYSFEDAVGLRLISKLRKKPYNISVRRLEALGHRLKQAGISNWSSARIWIVKGEPHYQDPKSGEVIGSETGQGAMLPIINVISEVEEKVRDLQSRDQSSFGRISKSRHVLRNSLVIAGTRIPVATILRYLEAGYNHEQIIGEYPTLTVRDIEAAIAVNVDNEIAKNG